MRPRRASLPQPGTIWLPTRPGSCAISRTVVKLYQPMQWWKWPWLWWSRTEVHYTSEISRKPIVILASTWDDWRRRERAISYCPDVP